MSTILEVRDLQKRFGGHAAVEGASLDLERGSMTALLGPNGAGKSTCLDCITGALEPDGGTIVFDGRPTRGLPRHRVARLGLLRVIEPPREQVSMTVLESVMLPARHLAEHVWENWWHPREMVAEERDVTERALDALQQLNLGAYASDAVAALPEGERLLLGYARVLMAEPRMVVLDEPCARLDGGQIRRLVDAVRRLRARSGVAFLVGAHERDELMRQCDNVVFMVGGRIASIGPAGRVLTSRSARESYLGVGAS